MVTPHVKNASEAPAGWAAVEVRQSLLDSGIVAYSTVTIKKDRRIFCCPVMVRSQKIAQSVCTFPGYSGYSKHV